MLTSLELILQSHCVHHQKLQALTDRLPGGGYLRFDLELSSAPDRNGVKGRLPLQGPQFGMNNLAIPEKQKTGLISLFNGNPAGKTGHTFYLQ